jgi:hypothetical protein
VFQFMRQGMFSQQSFNRVAAEDKPFWNTPAAASPGVSSGVPTGASSRSATRRTARHSSARRELNRSELNRNERADVSRNETASADTTGSVDAVAASRELPDVTGFLVVVLVTLGLFVVPVGATIMQGPAIVASIFGR